MKRTAVVAGALASLFLIASADVASARSTYHRHYANCSRHVHKNANKGTVIGALGGAFLGSQIAGHGARTEGTLIGAGAGALAGHSIGKHRARC